MRFLNAGYGGTVSRGSLFFIDMIKVLYQIEKEHLHRLITDSMTLNELRKKKISEIRKSDLSKPVDEFLHYIECEKFKKVQMPEFVRGHRVAEDDYLHLESGHVSETDGNFIVAYATIGAEGTFSIGMPVYDEDGNLMGNLGIGLYKNLNYAQDMCNEKIPAYYWQICNPTDFCRVNKKVMSYWQNKQRL